MPRLIDFQQEDEAPRWRAINDDVMGGVSLGEMRGEGSASPCPGMSSKPCSAAGDLRMPRRSTPRGSSRWDF